MLCCGCHAKLREVAAGAGACQWSQPPAEGQHRPPKFCQIPGPPVWLCGGRSSTRPAANCDAGWHARNGGQPIPCSSADAALPASPAAATGRRAAGSNPAAAAAGGHAAAPSAAGTAAPAAPGHGAACSQRLPSLTGHARAAPHKWDVPGLAAACGCPSAGRSRAIAPSTGGSCCSLCSCWWRIEEAS